MNPQTISVVLPNYNDADHIGISLKTLCEQDHPPLEVIVVDDASKDNSVEIIKNFSVLYPCIRLFRNETNRGVCGSINKGIKLATGNYIHVATANDYILPGLFRKSISLLSRYPEAGLSFSNTSEANNETGTINHEHTWLPNKGFISSSELADIAHATRHPLCLGVSGSLIRRDLVLRYQSFIPELGPLADWFLCLVVALRHGVCYVPEILAVVNSSNTRYSYKIWHDHMRFKQICTKLFQLLASSGYEDITPLVIRCHSLCTLAPWGREPSVVFNALRKMSNHNRHTGKLLSHLTGWYIYGVFSRHTVPGPGVLKLLTMKMAPICNSFITAAYYLQNVFDRVYARSFHEYDRVRSRVFKHLHKGKKRQKSADNPCNQNIACENPKPRQG